MIKFCMRFKLPKSFFSIVFVLATLLGVFHHHDELTPHNDCQICTIQSSIADADTPSETSYLSKIELFSDTAISKFPVLHVCQQSILLKARAPPFFS
jgi:hypothetical protein